MLKIKVSDQVLGILIVPAKVPPLEANKVIGFITLVVDQHLAVIGLGSQDSVLPPIKAQRFALSALVNHILVIGIHQRKVHVVSGARADIGERYRYRKQ